MQLAQMSEHWRINYIQFLSEQDQNTKHWIHICSVVYDKLLFKDMIVLFLRVHSQILFPENIV
jgi:hypothetical protein